MSRMNECLIRKCKLLIQIAELWRIAALGYDLIFKQAENSFILSGKEGTSIYYILGGQIVAHKQAVSEANCGT